MPALCEAAEGGFPACHFGMAADALMHALWTPYGVQCIKNQHGVSSCLLHVQLACSYSQHKAPRLLGAMPWGPPARLWTHNRGPMYQGLSPSQESMLRCSRRKALRKGRRCARGGASFAARARMPTRARPAARTGQLKRLFRSVRACWIVNLLIDGLVPLQPCTAQGARPDRARTLAGKCASSASALHWSLGGPLRRFKPH